MTSLNIFGTAPVKDLVDLGIVPEELLGQVESMPFSTSIFQTRTGSGAREMAEVFSFDPRNAASYIVDLAAIDMNTKEMMLDLPEVLRMSGEEDHLETFNRLRQIPGLTAVIEWS